MSGNLLSCKTVKEPFEVQERMCHFPHDAAAEKGLISPGGKNLLVFLELRQVPVELRWGPQGAVCVASGKASHYSRFERPLRSPLFSVLGPKS